MSKSSVAREVQVPTDVLMTEVKRVLASGHSATFIVRGFSMMPFLWNSRDRVTLAPLPPGERPVPGDVLLAEIAPHTYVLHRLIHYDNGVLTLMGDGNIRGTEQCTLDHVIGRVTAFYRKERTTPDLVEGRKWRIYSRMWMALKPLRRILLAVIRRLPFRI